MGRILVVDDEEANRRLLEAILLGDGFDVVEAADGAQALAALADRSIDLVLLDVMMPKMSGFKVCQRIRGELGLGFLPVVFVTALGDRASRLRSKDVGADDFLTKPVDDLELLVRVKSLVRIKRLHDENERQRSLMHAILDSMAEGVVAVDGAGRHTQFNRAAEALLGPPAGAGGSAEDGPRASIARALLGEAASDRTLVASQPDARQPAGCHLSVSTRPLEDSAGRRHGAVAVFGDVTRLAELDRLKAMTSGLIHDLKNFMSVIRSTVDFALEIGSEDEALAGAMMDAKDAGDRGLRILANLHDITKIESGRIAPTPMTIGAKALFDEVAGQWASRLRAGEIALDVSSGSVDSVTADHDLLLRVIENIFDKAVRYTPRGGRISLRADAVADDRIQIRIGNSGPAIPAKYREAILEKDGHSEPGSGKMTLGLGLYFSRLALQVNGGRIWIESTPELPTIFAMELAGFRTGVQRPIEPEVDADADAEEEPEPAAGFANR